MKNVKDIITKEKLRKELEYVLDMVYTRDNSLIIRELHEVCIMHRFALYLEPYVNSLGERFSCDIEYNRNMYSPKYIGDNMCRPDLIIHERESNTNNLLILECKAYWSQESNEKDNDKISKFCAIDGDYQYVYGGLLYLGRTRKEATITFLDDAGVVW